MRELLWRSETVSEGVEVSVLGKNHRTAYLKTLDPLMSHVGVEADFSHLVQDRGEERRGKER